MKKLVAILLIVVLAAVVFGCAQQQTPATPTKAPAAPTKAPDNGGTQTPEPTEEQEIVNVVLLAPMSGPYASYGVLIDAGMQGYAARF
jgi:hypothetical protein